MAAPRHEQNGDMERHQWMSEEELGTRSNVRRLHISGLGSARREQFGWFFYRRPPHHRPRRAPTKATA